MVSWSLHKYIYRICERARVIHIYIYIYIYIYVCVRILSEKIYTHPYIITSVPHVSSGTTLAIIWCFLIHLPSMLLSILQLQNSKNRGENTQTNAGFGSSERLPRMSGAPPQPDDATLQLVKRTQPGFFFFLYALHFTISQLCNNYINVELPDVSSSTLQEFLCHLAISRRQKRKKTYPRFPIKF